MDLASTGLKVFGLVKSGKDAKKSGKRDAAKLRREAAARRAEGHHAAEEEQRQARHIYSRALALAAASGGGTGGTIANILGDIDAEGDYRALQRRYSADAEAQSMDENADIVESEGRAAYTASGIRAATTLFTDAPDLWGKYKKYI